MTEARILIRTLRLWLALYPERGRKVDCWLDRNSDGWHLSFGFGWIYLGIGNRRALRI